MAGNIQFCESGESSSAYFFFFFLSFFGIFFFLFHILTPCIFHFGISNLHICSFSSTPMASHLILQFSTEAATQNNTHTQSEQRTFQMRLLSTQQQQDLYIYIYPVYHFLPSSDRHIACRQTEVVASQLQTLVLFHLAVSPVLRRPQSPVHVIRPAAAAAGFNDDQCRTGRPNSFGHSTGFRARPGRLFVRPSLKRYHLGRPSESHH